MTNLSIGTSVFGCTNEIFTNHNFENEEMSQFDEVLPKVTLTEPASEKKLTKVSSTFLEDSIQHLKNIGHITQTATEASNGAGSNTIQSFLQDKIITDEATIQNQEEDGQAKKGQSACIFKDNGVETTNNVMRYCIRKNYISKKTGCVNTDVFECKICHKQMRQLCNFKSHLRVHLNLKPFKCSTCGKGFATRSNCNHHMKKAVCSRRFYVKPE